MMKKELSEEELQINIKNVKLIYLGFGGTIGVIVNILLMQSDVFGKEFATFILIEATFFLMFALIGIFNLGLLILTNPRPVKFFLDTLLNDLRN